MKSSAVLTFTKQNSLRSPDWKSDNFVTFWRMQKLVKAGGLKVRQLWCSWIWYYITDVFHTCYVTDEAFKSETES